VWLKLLIYGPISNSEYLQGGFPPLSLAGQPESGDVDTSVLFDEDMWNALYSLRSEGLLDILSDQSVSDMDCIRILNKLKAHPDIPSIFAGKGKVPTVRSSKGNNSMRKVLPV